MTGDIIIKDASAFEGQGALPFLVAAGATAIHAGEPVTCPLGAVQAAIVCPTNAPVVGTDYVAGVAATDSTQTASVAGVVNCYPVNPAAVFLIAPNVAATWNTQAKYDALVGSRVLFNLTTGTYTILAADSANNGLVVRPLDIFKYPGKVAFSFRAATSYVA